MGMAPAEIRHVALGRSVLGYRRAEVDALLDEIAEDFEAIWRERMDLQERLERLEGEVERFRENDELLRRTLITAEKSAADQREAARQDAQRIVKQAEQDAREILGEAHHARSAVWREIQTIEQRGREIAARYRAFLATAEGLLDDVEDDERTEEREPLAEAITLH
jgi:cell division initiation protein